MVVPGLRGGTLLAPCLQGACACLAVSNFGMIRRFGFRRLLPLVLTLVQVLLVSAESEHRVQRPSNILSRTTYRVVNHQEGYGTMTTDSVTSRPLTLAFKLSIVLNLPAFFVGALLVAAFSRGSELSALWASTLFVPVLWFGIGRWLDGILGYRVRRLRAPVTWRAFWALLATISLLIGIASVTPLDHHVTDDTIWVSSALILWSMLLLVISASGYIRCSAN